MEQRNCKNCGAPLEHSYNHKCPYCGTLYDFNMPKEKTVTVKPSELININLYNFEEVPVKRTILFYFDGYKLNKPKIYEVSGDLYVSSVEENIYPPRAMICLEVPINTLERKGLFFVINELENMGVSYKDVQCIYEQLRNKLGWRFPSYVC